ncbi:26S proteasome non-ATPase regulatory subunit 6 [Anthophora plagiata]
MPLENLEEEGLEKNPNLELAQIKFLLSLPEHKDDPFLKNKLLDAIKAENMAPFYEEVCKDLDWPVDDTLLSAMKAKNMEQLKELDDAIEDADQNLGEMEVREANLKKSEHLCRIGDKEDHDHITRNIEKAKSLIEEGGDWDRRNRLKVYQGTYCIAGSEILEVLHSNPDVKDYLFSLYNCQYADFFKNLAHVEGLLRRDYLIFPHYRYYVREMRILAYTQLLESYRSLTLQYMAEAFGVTVEYIDQELSRFIAAGRLHCKVDCVGGVVETNRPDSKNWQYQAMVKQGDLLLNRVQKLSRVINI